MGDGQKQKLKRPPRTALLILAGLAVASSSAISSLLMDRMTNSGASRSARTSSEEEAFILPSVMTATAEAGGAPRAGPLWQQNSTAPRSAADGGRQTVPGGPPRCAYPCQRAFLVVHKMGYVYAEDIVKRVYPRDRVVHREIVGLPAWTDGFNKVYRTPKTDYRHVLVTRDFQEAVLSGYFYHRTGRECWLNWNGERGVNGTNFPGWLMKQTAWSNRITAANRKLFPVPPARGRNLCRFLMEEPPRVGFRAYLEWTYNLHLAPLWSFYQDRQRSESGRVKKTLHVCYDEIVNDYDESIASFTRHFGLDEKVDRSRGYTAATRQASAANHGTAKNETLKEELKALYHELDKMLFDGRLSKWNDALGC
jgi:hypothetical protein